MSPLRSRVVANSLVNAPDTKSKSGNVEHRRLNLLFYFCIIIEDVLLWFVMTYEHLPLPLINHWFCEVNPFWIFTFPLDFVNKQSSNFTSSCFEVVVLVNKDIWFVTSLNLFYPKKYL